MKIFFVDRNCSALADNESRMLVRVRNALLKDESILEVGSPGQADVILIQEKGSYKDFRYIDKLLNDPLISAFAGKVYTINSDDCATGLLPGLYTSLPRSRFNTSLHRAVPYMEYPNELVFSARQTEKLPPFLASWRGNTRSNSLRPKMIACFKDNDKFCLETSDSWLNHQSDEKQAYVDLILDAKFSLCPAGWAPVSFRIYESMALGRCPVILADDFVPPEGPNWNGFALFYPEKKIAGLLEFLHQHEKFHATLGEKALIAWDENFNNVSVDNYFVRTLLDLIRTSTRRTKDMELKRWRSLNLFWSNNWTIPQRVVNRARKWSRVLVHKN